MTGGAIAMMIIGMVILWGGLIASMAWAAVKGKRNQSES